MSEAAIGPSKDQNVQKSQLIVGLPLNGELYPWVNLIEVCQEPAEFFLSICLIHKNNLKSLKLFFTYNENNLLRIVCTCMYTENISTCAVIYLC